MNFENFVYNLPRLHRRHRNYRIFSFARACPLHYCGGGSVHCRCLAAACIAERTQKECTAARCFLRGSICKRQRADFHIRKLSDASPSRQGKCSLAAAHRLQAVERAKHCPDQGIDNGRAGGTQPRGSRGIPCCRSIAYSGAFRAARGHYLWHLVCSPLSPRRQQASAMD